MMVSITDAVHDILDRSKILDARNIPLADALGLVLAQDVAADLDLPPFDKSLVDGYAVRASDLEISKRLKKGEEILAGKLPSRPLAPGEAAAIMTGAPMPIGADAVVMVEKSREIGEEVEFETSVKTGQNVLKRAREMKKGEIVATKGRRLGPAEMGLLASVGCVRPLVVPRPTVVVIPTGDELVEPDQAPRAGEIRNSNGMMLAALATEAGAEVDLKAIAKDEPKALRQSLKSGLEADVLLVTGGVSAGKKDLVPATLTDLGVKNVFHKVAVRPGKPLWFGIGPKRGEKPGTLVFGLPGNPGSGIVGFLLFVRPALERLAGRSEPDSREIEGVLAVPFTHRGDRTTFQPSIWTEDGLILPLDWAGSADLRTIARADGFARFPAGDRLHEKGEKIGFLPLR